MIAKAVNSLHQELQVSNTTCGHYEKDIIVGNGSVSLGYFLEDKVKVIGLQTGSKSKDTVDDE